MSDAQIIALFRQRDETAIAQAEQCYGAYCRKIALQLLGSREDAEECVSDTWLRAWNAIPPAQPAQLRPFLARITRNLALDRLRVRGADKRGGGELPAVLEELSECVAAPGGTESAILAKELQQAIQKFVHSLPARDGNLFTRRYFFAEPVSEIAARFGLTPHNATVILARTRQKLRRFLEQEGFLP